MQNFQKSKEVVRNYIAAFDTASQDQMESVLAEHTASDYYWRGMHPFYEQIGAEAVVDTFWRPFRNAFAPVQRREDIFFAGANECDNGDTQWVVSTGNFLGLFDKNWLGIPSTGKMAFLRYVEFHRVNQDGKIAETALFCDILSLMDQAGQYPLPPMTGASFLYPGPRTHDGLLFGEQEPEEAADTMKVLNQMIADLDELNKSGNDHCSPELLSRTWAEDMIWYGPTGIGASYTIERYQDQHQFPFRENLEDKVFNGHIARLAEGNYCGFFGWPNLNNKNKGGFLGLPKSEVHAPMRVVDIYRRDGDKLAENWVYIDMLHYLFEQGLDVLGRMKKINRTY
ncbi:MAG: ester cyclase [Reichenbachiella sp.]|uniref:nuclear transport factor 2 family protein n=1 Tax=Reichenbachiella sp. TaxID=2184521 RepID=UPI0032668825